MQAKQAELDFSLHLNFASGARNIAGDGCCICQSATSVSFYSFEVRELRFGTHQFAICQFAIVIYPYEPVHHTP